MRVGASARSQPVFQGVFNASFSIKLQTLNLSPAVLPGPRTEIYGSCMVSEIVCSGGISRQRVYVLRSAPYGTYFINPVRTMYKGNSSWQVKPRVPQSGDFFKDIRTSITCKISMAVFVYVGLGINYPLDFYTTFYLYWYFYY